MDRGYRPKIKKKELTPYDAQFRVVFDAIRQLRDIFRYRAVCIVQWAEGDFRRKAL